MNTPLLPLPLPSANVLGAVKKNRVLLVDTSANKRTLRAEIMRKLGIDVDCAADIGEARSWWKADFYDLVLIHMEKGEGHRDQFCEDIRKASPLQRLAFLVGKPEYLANSPNVDEVFPAGNGHDSSVAGDIKAALTADAGGLRQRWGILEASRRISAVRSACSARTQAMRALPSPPRDSEGRGSKRIPTVPSLDDLLRKELQ
jgi:CheY-like chemotaxis protein